MNLQNLINETKSLIAAASLESQKKNKKRIRYTGNIKKNIISLSQELPLLELSQTLGIPNSSLRYILFPKSANKEAGVSDVFNFIDLSKREDGAAHSQASNHQKKIFMKLTTLSGVVVEIFE